MAFKMKTIASAIALSMVAGTAMAAEKKSANEGKWSGMVKLQNVVDAKDNRYDPNSGQAWMLKLKYVSPKMNGFRLGTGFYAVDDVFNVTDTRVKVDGRPASGLYATDGDNAGNELEPYLQGIFGELYVTYKQKKYDAYAGRMIFDSPLTTSAESTVPDFHTLAGANFKINKQFKFGLAHMVEASMGTRAANEYGLIGEGTGTGGTVVQPLGPIQASSSTSLNRVEFHELSTIALGKGAEDTAGMTILSANYRPAKNVNIELWDFYAHDIFNAVYAEARHTSKVAGKKKLILSGQYLTQTEVGDKLAGDIDFNLFGAKAEIKSRKWGAHIAMNQSNGDTGMFNAFSGDPGYTSTQFSRNEYRKNVNAYQIGARYSFNKQWIAKVNYANYGKSDSTATYDADGGVIGGTTANVIPGMPLTSTGANPLTAQKDAEEMDIKLIWRATKKGTLVLTHSIRTSEFDGINDQDLTMAHTRLIGIYRF